MTHYNENPGSVRVDYWKASGKWYMTEAVDMSPLWDTPDIFLAVRHAMDNHWQRTRDEPDGWKRFTITVTEPYHRNAYPIMLKADE